MVSAQKAEQEILSNYWQNRPVPLDFVELAQKFGFEVQTKIVQGHGMIKVEGNVLLVNASSELSIRKLLAFALSKRWLTQAPENYVYQNQEWKNSYDSQIILAQKIASRLLVPSYALRILVVDQGWTSVERIKKVFQVEESLLIERLKEEKYIR